MVRFTKQIKSILIIGLILLTGCGTRQNDDTSSPVNEDWGYIVSFIDNDIPNFTNNLISICHVDSEVLLCSKNYELITENGLSSSCIYTVDSASGESVQTDLVGIELDKLAESTDGYYGVIYDKGKRVLVEFDTEFNFLQSTEIGGVNLEIKDLVVVNNNIYILTENKPAINTILIYSNDFSFVGEIDINTYVCDIVESNGSAIVCWQDNIEHATRLGKIDENKLSIEEITDNLPLLTNINIWTSGDGIYFVTDEALYEYSLNNNSTSKVIDLIENALLGKYIIDVHDEDGIIYFWSIESEQKSAHEISEKPYSIVIAMAKPVPSEEIIEKQAISVSTCGYPGYDLYSNIIQFQRLNPEYKVEFVNYISDGYSLEYGEYVKDVINGNCADVLIIPKSNVSSITSLSQANVLYDLTEYLETDPELNKDSFIQSIYDLWDNNGIYALTDDFILKSLYINKSFDISNWNIESIYNLSQQMNIPLKEGETSDGILYLLLYDCITDYYSKEKEICRFDSDSFISLLKLAKDSGDYNGGQYYYVPDAVVFSEGTAILNSCSSLNKAVLAEMYDTLGADKFSFVGYPFSDGGSAIVIWGDMYCMSSQSNNKDAAWELIKYCIQNGYFEYQLPTIKNRYVEYIAQGVNEEIKYPVYNREYEQIGFAEKSDVPIEEQLGVLDEVIAGVKHSNFEADMDIFNIVIEEAGAYFAGQKSAEEVADIIQNRAMLKLYE